VYSGLSKNGENLCQCVAKFSREELGVEVHDRLDGCWVWREDRDCVGRVVDEVVLSESGT